MAGVRFLRELRRRHVFRVAAGYAVVGRLLVQVATRVFLFFAWPAAALPDPGAALAGNSHG